MPSATFDQVTIWIQAFISPPIIEAVGACFHGDGRSFSNDYNEQRFRIRSDIVISGFLSGSPQWFESHQVGETSRVDCVSSDVLESGYADTDRMSFHDFQVGGTYPDPEGGIIDLPSDETAAVMYDGVTENPLTVPSPDVDMAIFLWVDPVVRVLSVRGAVNAFPDYEAYVMVDGGSPQTIFNHVHSLDPVFGLPGGADQIVTAEINI